MQNVQTARARTQRTLGQPTVLPPPCAPLLFCLSHAANLLQPPCCIFHFAARSAVIWIKYGSAVLQSGAGVAVGSLWVLQLQLQPGWSCGLLGWLKLITFFMAHISYFSQPPPSPFLAYCILWTLFFFYLCHVLGLSLSLSLVIFPLY